MNVVSITYTSNIVCRTNNTINNDFNTFLIHCQNDVMVVVIKQTSSSVSLVTNSGLRRQRDFRSMQTFDKARRSLYDFELVEFFRSKDQSVCVGVNFVSFKNIIFYCAILQTMSQNQCVEIFMTQLLIIAEIQSIQNCEIILGIYKYDIRFGTEGISVSL